MLYYMGQCTYQHNPIVVKTGALNSNTGKSHVHNLIIFLQEAPILHWGEGGTEERLKTGRGTEERLKIG